MIRDGSSDSGWQFGFGMAVRVRDDNSGRKHSSYFSGWPDHPIRSALTFIPHAATLTQLQATMSAADEYAISVAKTEYREGYNTADVERILSVFADSFTNMSEGEPSFYGDEAKQALRQQLSNLFSEYQVR